MPVNYDSRFSDYDVKTVMPCPPFGNMIIRHPNIEKCEWFSKIGKNIITDWNQYWDGIYTSTKKTMKQYSEIDKFGKMPFEIHVNKSGGWINDDMMFELIFTPGDDSISCGPFFITAFSGRKIIHSSASY